MTALRGTAIASAVMIAATIAVILATSGLATPTTKHAAARERPRGFV